MMQSWQFGVKIGAFAPLLWTTDQSQVTTSLITDIDAGSMTASVNMSVPAYSALDYTDLDIGSPEDILGILNGLKVDTGFIYVEDRKPVFGANISGITVVPAEVTNRTQIDFNAEVGITNVLDAALNQEFDQALALNVEAPTVDVGASEPQKVSLPLQIGGFYRYTGLPLLAVTGHTQIYLADPSWYALGVHVEGDVFPFNMFSAGLGWDRVVWEAYTGFRLSLHVVELGFDLGFSSPRLATILAGSGVDAQFYFAVGL
jgi:hypothetical protein